MQEQRAPNTNWSLSKMDGLLTIYLDSRYSKCSMRTMNSVRHWHKCIARFAFFPPNREIKFTKCHKLNFCIFLLSAQDMCIYLFCLHLPNAHPGENNTILSRICSSRSVSFNIHRPDILAKFPAAKRQQMCTCDWRSFRLRCCDSRNRRTRTGHRCLRHKFLVLSSSHSHSLDNAQNMFVVATGRRDAISTVHAVLFSGQSCYALAQ